MLHAIIFQPLILFFEFVYNVAYSLTEHPALSIIFLSLAMNFLVLPLYKRADEMQNEQRLKEKSMEKDIAFLKKTFKGDERMMVLETYYRQHNYKPIYILKGSLSLALEIPFFVAAY